jgi:Mn-dependent DtxR family transcriptional regulator
MEQFLKNFLAKKTGVEDKRAREKKQRLEMVHIINQQVLEREQEYFTNKSIPFGTFCRNEYGQSLFEESGRNSYSKK